MEQTERMKAAEAEAQRQKSVEDRRIAERLAKLEEDNRRAAAELAARTKAEETMRALPSARGLSSPPR